MKGKTIAKSMLAGVIILAVILATVVLVILLNDAQKTIPVQYAKKEVQGQKWWVEQSTHIPLKINTRCESRLSLQSSILSMPNMIASFAGYEEAKRESERHCLACAASRTGVIRIIRFTLSD